MALAQAAALLEQRGIRAFIEARRRQLSPSHQRGRANTQSRPRHPRPRPRRAVASTAQTTVGPPRAPPNARLRRTRRLSLNRAGAAAPAHSARATKKKAASAQSANPMERPHAPFPVAKSTTRISEPTASRGRFVRQNNRQSGGPRRLTSVRVNLSRGRAVAPQESSDANIRARDHTTTFCLERAFTPT